MAKVAAESLPWLSKPSTGYDLFTKPSSFRPPPSDDLLGVPPQRRIATRDSEVYFAVGNEVRCADLQDLKARHPVIDVVAEGAKRVGHREHKVSSLY
jgi:nucleoporin NUP82